VHKLLPGKDLRFFVDITRVFNGVIGTAGRVVGVVGFGG
jgi:hypothetical protein